MSVATSDPTLPDLTRAYTAAELLLFPSHWHYELVAGHLRRMNLPTGAPHGALTAVISAHFTLFVVSRGLGHCFAAETGFLLARDPDTVLAPDFAFVARDRLPDGVTVGFVPAAPDLVLETRSPSDRPRAIAAKVQAWLDAGVRLVLELDPAGRVLNVHRPNATSLALGPDDTLDGFDVIPGFSLPLAGLFAAP